MFSTHTPQQNPTQEPLEPQHLTYPANTGRCWHVRRKHSQIRSQYASMVQRCHPSDLHPQGQGDFPPQFKIPILPNTSSLHADPDPNEPMNIPLHTYPSPRSTPLATKNAKNTINKCPVQAHKHRDGIIFYVLHHHHHES